jgi:hypothetical protein
MTSDLVKSEVVGDIRLENKAFMVDTFCELLNKTNIKHDCHCEEISRVALLGAIGVVCEQDGWDTDDFTLIYEKPKEGEPVETSAFIDASITPEGAYKIALLLDNNLMPFVMAYISFIIEPEIMDIYQHPFKFEME